MPDWAQGTTGKIEKDETGPEHSCTTEDITVRVIAIYTEATLDHNTGIDTATTEAAHDDLTQHTEDAAKDLAMTHCIGHITDHPCMAAVWVIDPKIIVGHTHNHPTDLQGMNHTDQIHTAAEQEESYTQRGTWRWRQKTPKLITTAQMINPVTQERNQIL